MATRRSSRSSRSSNKPGLGCLLWLAAFTVVFVIFFLNLPAIRETLDRTGFSELVKGRGSETAPPSSPVGSEPSDIEDEPGPTPPATTPGGVVVVAPDAGPEAEPEPEPEPEPDSGPSALPAPTPDPTPGAAAPSGGSAPKPAPATPKTRVASLWFVRIDDDGVIVRVESRRAVPDTGSPLTDALNALLEGPSAGELDKDLISAIPAGTRLLSSVRISGSTATLNFNEAFQFNHMGLEGYAAQVKQIVWTATAFPTVTDVQFLIEGERRDYLGAEGFYIGKPLSRNSF
ncbi:MAG TPA: GerMN domain-containing protein [Spirochaetales bacterium]|nr:GerMN domain-containing protein [Spirochaetales bacterium]